MKVLVIMGGPSAERDVSLRSAAYATEALKEGGFEIQELEFEPSQDFVRTLMRANTDCVFNAMHGMWGEDGRLAALCEILRIPITHSGFQASCLGMNKWASKCWMIQSKIRTPDGMLIGATNLKPSPPDLPFPWIVKPNTSGSSLGVEKIMDIAQWKVWTAQRQSVSHNTSDDFVLEAFVSGRELTCSVLGGQILGLSEVIWPANDQDNGLFDHARKYHDGSSQHVHAPDLATDVAETIKDWSKTLHVALGVHGTSRVDFRFDHSKGVEGIYALEINTHPGLSSSSFLPEHARVCGLAPTQLVGYLVEEALARAQGRTPPLPPHFAPICAHMNR